MAAATSATESTKVAGGPTQEHRFPAIWPGALGILFLLLAVVPTLPNEYFTVLRYIVCGLSAVMILLAGQCRRWEWIVPFLLLAALFNPIHWPGFGLRYWQLADGAGALLFLLGSYFLYPKPKATEKKPTDETPTTEPPAPASGSR
jgi:hypothetical protein